MFASVHNVVNDLSLGITAFASVAAIVLGFYAANIRLKVAKRDNTLTATEESNAAYKSLHETDQLQIEAKDKEIIVLRQKAEILEKHVTQGPDIAKLTMQIGEQHKEIMSGMSKMTHELGNVAKALSKEVSNASK